MNIKQNLIETFQFNEKANLRLLTKLEQLQDPAEAIRLFSHLINCMDKWHDRLIVFPEISRLDWWEPLFSFEEMKTEWPRCSQKWIAFMESKTEEEIMQPIQWIGVEDVPFTARLYDIALQLNYHSVHHRAQMQTMIRQQGMKPDFLDYIGTVARKV